ncbi:ArsR/SmtB family transcription factor [Variovorax sp. PAMC 28711]|uniref:ArsR/SmtB family transcription factor n=1 Tax=Variovorax sp. PAMC 28711 TaxID=1795631 RepID=UPI0012E72F5C|nr:metalloregulator ArsR/SmtB family transcription factor [Variovorax sp. PAMC 28711]
MISNYQPERDQSPGTRSQEEASRAGLPMASGTLTAVRLLKAIAQETRLRIIELLQQEDSLGLPAGVIAASLDIPPNLISFHLKELAAAGILQKKTSGRNIIYSIDSEIMESFFVEMMKYRVLPRS